MPLFDLLSVPRNEQEWDAYAFSTRNQIELIRQAVMKQKNVNLTQYQLYPLDLSDQQRTQFWLQNNSQAHNDFNAVMGLQASDLEDVDFKDEKQTEAWINLVYQELYTVSSLLKI